MTAISAVHLPINGRLVGNFSFKRALLLILACGKRVGDLHALSTDAACMEFGNDDCMVRLQPRPGYVTKVLSTLFRAQILTVQVFAPQDSPSTLHTHMPSPSFACLSGQVQSL